jgi:hypothetical protein
MLFAFIVKNKKQGKIKIEEQIIILIPVVGFGKKESLGSLQYEHVRHEPAPESSKKPEQNSRSL